LPCDGKFHERFKGNQEKRLDLEAQKGTDAPRDYILFVGYPEHELKA
jgi:hypothetical protein